MALRLVRAQPEAAASWAQQGLTGVHVTGLSDGWSALTPSTPSSAVPPPYDDPVAVLLNRPVPHRMRPAFGVGVVGRQALLTATAGGWRAVPRWVAWQPGVGVVRPGGLAPLRVADLVHLSGSEAPGALGDVADVLHDPTGSPVETLRRLLAALGLPGGGLLGAPVDDEARHVTPAPRGVAAFARMVADDASWHAEMTAPDDADEGRPSAGRRTDPSTDSPDSPDTEEHR
ncbi:hypothetical protein [Lapillicoccus jejuensis]|uniref:Uncharacterized protein n=1 Tax=Lapillicoccus jejuensis TaxID=402171 RepID=A0A542E6P9_9MICO|nr:hypothetical protein [Lapillicoccus jejuensis]TQJ11007.1 hypothetical protein FB458_4155 [Lapillicoccus jejuensis]